MGGLFCKQRSRSRPQHSAQSRRKKLHRVHCLLRAPCLLCFIVHSEHPTNETTSPEQPAPQDCARLLLLCPGELSAWQERPLCGELLKDPGPLCTTFSQKSAEDMVCKRKNCGENQQSLTPCKQPRCSPTREQAHPQGEDLPQHPKAEGLSPHAQTGEPSLQLHCGGLSAHNQAEDLPPHPKTGDLSLCPHAQEVSLHCHCEDLSPCSEGETIRTHCGDLSPYIGGETAHSQTEHLSPHPQTGNLSPCPGGKKTPPQSTELSSSPGGQTVHPKPGDSSSCPCQKTEHPVPRDITHSSAGHIHHFVDVMAPSCSAQKVYCQGKWQLSGDPALARIEQHASSLFGSMSYNSIEEHPPSGDLTMACAEDQEPHCSGVKTVKCHGGGHISGDSVFSCTGESHHTPANMEPFHLGVEDHRQPSQNSCKLSSSSTMCQDHKPSSLGTVSHAELPFSGCNQAVISQSPKVEGEMLVSCEPLHINQLPPSLLLKIFSLLSLNERSLSASLVCKYWRDLCLDFQFWKQLDLSSRQQVKDNLLEKISSRCWNITEINISDCLNVSDAGISKLAMNCSGLMKYTAYRCKQLSDSSLISLATHCPSLQKVHVGNQDRLTDNALKQLGSRCKDLRDIHFGQCYKISDEGMVVIAKGCLKLQKIYMQENKLVTNRSVEAFAEHCSELQYVGFMGCSVTSHGVIHLTNLKNLSSLDLRNITELDNQTVEEIVKRCQNLTSLNLCLNRNINDRCVEVIAKEGRSLRELYLVTCKITDYALIAIGRYSSTIETVDVGWCKEITDQGATLIAQSSKSIRYLGLMRCDQVNESTVEQLVQQYPHITFSTVLQDCKRTLERAYQMGWTPNASSVS